MAGVDPGGHRGERSVDPLLNVRESKRLIWLCYKKYHNALILGLSVSYISTSQVDVSSSKKQILNCTEYKQEFIIYILRESVQCSYILYKHTVWSYDATIPYSYSCLFLDKIYTWQVHKEVLINKHWVKAAYFELMCLCKCGQNWWRYCEIGSFCMNPWIFATVSHAGYTSNFFGGELKCKDSLFLQRNGDDSHISYGKPFNWKSTFSSL